MKKLLFLLFFVLVFISCTQQSNSIEDSLTIQLDSVEDFTFTEGIWNVTLEQKSNIPEQETNSSATTNYKYEITGTNPDSKVIRTLLSGTSIAKFNNVNIYQQTKNAIEQSQDNGTLPSGYLYSFNDSNLTMTCTFTDEMLNSYEMPYKDIYTQFYSAGMEYSNINILRNDEKTIFIFSADTRFSNVTGSLKYKFIKQ